MDGTHRAGSDVTGFGSVLSSMQKQVLIFHCLWNEESNKFQFKNVLERAGLPFESMNQVGKRERSGRTPDTSGIATVTNRIDKLHDPYLTEKERKPGQ